MKLRSVALTGFLLVGVTACSTPDSASTTAAELSEYGAATESDDGAFAPTPAIAGDEFADPLPPNPWTAAATDPRSTFGLDVDTGSYSVARQYLRFGQEVVPESVRIEEFINSLEPASDAPIDADLAVTVDHGSTPLADADTEVVRISVRAREVDADQRPDANLTFVIDTSGSMDGDNRIGLVKRSLSLLVTSLRPTDSIGIVTFGDTAGVVLEPTTVRDADTILDAINSLGVGRSTNLEGGMRAGYRLAGQTFDRNKVNRVILASDGMANVGETGPGSLIELIEQDGNRGIRLVTVGFGMGGYNDALMEQVADLGDGFNAYVDTLSEAKRLFQTDLVGTLVTVADDARIQVEFDPAVVAEYRLLGYQNRAIADDEFRNPETDAGEIGAGHSVTALYEIHRTGVAAEQLGRVHLRWVSAESGTTIETETPIVAGTAVDERTRLTHAVARWAETLSLSQATPAASADIVREIDAGAKHFDSSVAAEMADLARQSLLGA